MRRWIDRKARENVVVCLAKAALIAALLAFVPVARASWEDMDAGIPYGKMSVKDVDRFLELSRSCLLYTSPSPRDGLLSRMPSSA